MTLVLQWIWPARTQDSRLEFGRRFGVPLRLAGVMEQTFIEGRAKYGGSAWSSMIVKLLEDAVGTPLRAPGFPARLGSGACLSTVGAAIQP